MSPFFGWLSSKPSSSSNDLLEAARTLAREGKRQEASDTYYRIKRKHRTAASLVEHAELLFELDDFFGAASMARCALDLEPENARATAIQKRVRAADEAAQRA